MGTRRKLDQYYTDEHALDAPPKPKSEPAKQRRKKRKKLAKDADRS